MTITIEVIVEDDKVPEVWLGGEGEVENVRILDYRADKLTKAVSTE